MNRVIPKISSGEFVLLLTESLCFNPIDGLKICIPTSDNKTGLPGKDITFNFIFNYNQEPSDRKIQTSILDNQVNLSINNFGNTIISGTLNPLTFQFGVVPIKLYFSGMLIKDANDIKLMNLTVSIYQGNIA